MDAENLVNDGAPEEEEEESEEEEEEEEEDDEEEDDEEDRDGVLEGGVAEETVKGKEPRKAAAADLCLFFTCTKSLPFCPEHPIIKADVTVQIGLDRTIKLEKVFSRYVDFCNEQYPAGKIDISDLEFVHAQVLSGHDNAEGASLMKNDRLQVRPESSDDRKEEEERHRRQRDMDKEYFAQMRTLLPHKHFSGSQSPHSVDKYADVIFDCRGSLPYVKGNDQMPCSLPSDTLVRAHSFFIYKRCPGLGRLITKAKEEYQRRSVVTVPEESKPAPSDDEDDFELLQNLNNDDRMQNEDSSNAAQIENDDDDHALETDRRSRRTSRNGKEAVNADDEASFSSAVALPMNLPVVVLEHHTADAVRLLLEYCYTNRCVPLGYEAFVQAAKNNHEHQLLYRKALAGPVAPFSYRPNRWPDSGNPAVSFPVAIGGIRLAEEFDVLRLSLMCEVAAGQLVDQYNAIDALQECGKVLTTSGNELPRLRKEAIRSVLRSCAVGGGAMGVVQHAMKDRCRLIVPSLFTATMDAIKEAEEKKTNMIGEKRDWQRMAFQYFENYDKNDERERERERRKRKRGQSPGDETDDEDDYDGAFGGFLAKAQSMSLKRMARHLRPGTSFDLLTRARKSRRIAS